MLSIRRKRIGKRGQTALEYAMVIGVICVGLIAAGKVIFGNQGSISEKLMKSAVKEATRTISEEAAKEIE